jgi:hypothetical protein
VLQKQKRITANMAGTRALCIVASCVGGGVQVQDGIPVMP